MKKYTLLHFSSVIVLLTSCGEAKPLRSDIRIFIASFSLPKTMEVYKEVEYESSYDRSKDGQKESGSVILSFNIKDQNNPSYLYSEYNYKNDVLDSEIHRQIVKENEQLYYIENDTKVPCEFSKCTELIKDYFYTYTEMEGIFHFGGNYMGDYLGQRARDIQDFITIDEENKLLKFDRTFSDSTQTLDHKYIVDVYGMWTSYSYHQTYQNDYVHETRNSTKK